MLSRNELHTGTLLWIGPAMIRPVRRAATGKVSSSSFPFISIYLVNRLFEARYGRARARFRFVHGPDGLRLVHRRVEQPSSLGARRLA